MDRQAPGQDHASSSMPSCPAACLVSSIMQRFPCKPTPERMLCRPTPERMLCRPTHVVLAHAGAYVVQTHARAYAVQTHARAYVVKTHDGAHVVLCTPTLEHMFCCALKAQNSFWMRLVVPQGMICVHAVHMMLAQQLTLPHVKLHCFVTGAGLQVNVTPSVVDGDEGSQNKCMHSHKMLRTKRMQARPPCVRAG